MARPRRGPRGFQNIGRAQIHSARADRRLNGGSLPFGADKWIVHADLGPTVPNAGAVGMEDTPITVRKQPVPSSVVVVMVIMLTATVVVMVVVVAPVVMVMTATVVVMVTAMRAGGLTAAHAHHKCKRADR